MNNQPFNLEAAIKNPERLRFIDHIWSREAIEIYGFKNGSICILWKNHNHPLSYDNVDNIFCLAPLTKIVKLQIWKGVIMHNSFCIRDVNEPIISLYWEKLGDVIEREVPI